MKYHIGLNKGLYLYMYLHFKMAQVKVLCYRLSHFHYKTVEINRLIVLVNFVYLVHYYMIVFI